MVKNNMEMSLNITTISFALSTFFSAAITWRSFSIWRKQKLNQIAKAFSQTLLFMTLYMGIRAIASFFFVDSSVLLASMYILSHVFLGIAMAYLIKFSLISFFNLSLAKLVFFIVLFLFTLDVIFNIILPNHPSFNHKMNIIEWGTNKYVGLYHSLLVWAVCLTAITVFTFKAYKNWQDAEIRSRSLIIAVGLLLSILVVIPRNIFPAPLFIVVSDIGYVLTFAIVLWAISL